MVTFVVFLALAAVLDLTSGIAIDRPSQQVKYDRKYDDSSMHSRRVHADHRSQTKKFSRSLAEQDEHEEYWYKEGQDALLANIRKTPIEAEAKNTILFLGDGMSIPTITAARILQGQLQNQSGEEGSLYFETFPYMALSKTFCSDSQVADSACSSTAYLTGSKGNLYTIGISPRINRDDSLCIAQEDPENRLDSILVWAQAAGKSTGIVTTTRVTHASPAGTYAHVKDRDYEDDAMMTELGGDPSLCDDIAEQLILNQPGRDINVIMGGGRNKLLPKGVFDPEETTLEGARLDGKNLINEWQTQHPDGIYITARQQLLDLDTRTTTNLLGLFSDSHLAYKEDMEKDDDPTLKEMVQVAIEILSKNPNGYFLFVEGGRIDHAHHDNFAQRALLETIEFAEAVKTADQMTWEDETLIVVTADHAHVMTINGYPDRGNDIIDRSGDLDDIGLPFTTLTYANGPGYRVPPKLDDDTCGRVDVTNDLVYDLNYQQEAMVQISQETHGGEDVAIFAKGPFAHLFSGVQYQSFIPHAMAYASCIGPGLRYC